MDNVQINKIQKCNAPSSISFRCITISVFERSTHDLDSEVNEIETADSSVNNYICNDFE
jgi:hypothetical protein